MKPSAPALGVPVTAFAVLLAAASCGPSLLRPCSSTCAGCCTSDGFCISGLTALTCGKGGQACAACGTSQTCSAGACVAPTGSGGGGTLGTGGGLGGTGGGVAGGTGGGAAGGAAGGSVQCTTLDL